MILALAPSLFAGAARPTFRTDPAYLIDTWESEDGLPENSATSMVQTRDGYLWFGTFNGLVRFDGVKFTVFNPSNTPQLPSPGVVALHLDKGGRLWVSTLRGMAVLSEGKWRSFTAQEGWDGNYARAIAERRNGDLLVTTFDGKVLEFTNGRFRALPSPPGEAGKGYVGYADETGRWWALQHAFVGVWDGERWAASISLPPAAPEQFSSAPALDGGLWLLAGQELRRYRNGKEVALVQVPGVRGGVWSMSEDSAGNVWVCTYDAGLYRVSPGGQVRHWNSGNGLSYDGTRFAFEDRERNIWVGTSGGGLTRFKSRQVRAFGAESGLSERVVNSVCADREGTIWFATYGKGLFRFKDGKFDNVPLVGPDGHALYGQSVLADRAGRVWVGTFGRGLWLLDKQGVRQLPRLPSGGNNVISLFEDSKGRIWMGDGVGVSRYDGRDPHSFTMDRGVPAGEVCCLGEASDGAIWFSNREGVFRLEGDRFVEVLTTRNRSIREVVCIKTDPDGTVWLGTADRGLLRWKEDRLSGMNGSTGFPVPGVYGILEDGQGYFWMTSNRGVLRVSRDDLQAVADGAEPRRNYQVLDASDGLPGTECTSARQPVCARDGAGRFWIATPKGVGMIEPARFRSNAPPPVTFVEELHYHRPARGDEATAEGDDAAKVHRRLEPPFGERTVLPAGVRHVEFRYTAPAFAAAERLRFQVRIEGRDRDWLDVGNQRILHYHMPGPGDYVFRTRAASDWGAWVEGTSLAFTVRPFYWQTGWFRYGVSLMLVICGGSTAWWVAHVRHRRSRQRLRCSQRQAEALLRLSTSKPPASGDLEPAFREITEVAALAIDVRRVGIWVLSDDETELRCADTFDAERGTHEKGAALRMADFPRYAESLREGRTIVAAEAMRDPRTSEFRAVYLAPLGISSMLDAAVRVSGRLVGVICFEHTGHPRKWRDDEVAFAGAVADHVAQALLDAQRERATAQLRDSEQRMTLAAEAAQLGMWVWNPADGHIWMSERCRRMFAFPPRGEITYLDLLQRIHPEDRTAVDRAVRAAIQAGSRYEGEYRLAIPDGTPRWVAARGTVAVDAAGALVRVQGVAADITARKQAEERFRLVVEAAPNAMILIDANGAILLVNGQAEVVFGYDRRELIGKPAELLLPERYRSEHIAHLRGDGANPVSRPMGAERELFGLRKDGSEIPIEAGLNPIRTSDGTLVLASIVDMTERRQAEAQADRQRSELARLSRATLLGELSGSLAHELNQPLTSILSNAQAAQRFLAGERPDLDEVREILADIVSDDKRAGEVIRRLRLLLKKGEAQHQELDLNEVVQDVLKLVRSDLVHNDVVVDTRLASSLPKVKGDVVQLQQVILNLIVNGCDAMADNGKLDRRLSVTTENNGDEGICVSVADLGCGVPPDRAEKVFEPFYTTKPHGTGLGLSICRTIVAAHAGKLWVSNNKGRGASFHLSLPQPSNACPLD